MEKEVKVKAPTNIAILKYWGKNEDWEIWHLPTKSSLSFTVENFYTTTSLRVKNGKGEVSLVLNNREIGKGEKELKNVEEFFEKLSELFPFVKNYDYEVITENNFPTAAGFASSASGFAALATALVNVLPEFEDYREEKKLSVIARLGSGSASRSAPYRGGFVLWNRGISPKVLKKPEEVEEKERRTIIFSSYAETIVEPKELEDLVIIYGIVKKEEKKVKSRGGMKLSVKTDPLYWDWVDYEESNLKDSMIELVRKKEWEELFRLIMIASNGLHASCLRTYPPIKYLNESSYEVIYSIHELNEDRIKAAYTFDAGPNPVVFTTKRDEEEVVKLLKELLGEGNVIVTKPGRGPEILEG